MMRVRFFLDSNNAVECQWATLSGRERYLHNGVEVLGLRSFAATGSREFSLCIDDEIKHVLIKVCFRPTLKTLLRSNGFIAAAYVNGELFVPDLLVSQFRLRSSFSKWVWLLSFIFAFALILIFVDARFFEGRISGVKGQLMPPSVEIINAALATPACRDSLDGYSASLLLPEWQAVKLREREMRRKSDWVLDAHRTAISTIATIYEQVGAVCQRSIRLLLDRYLANGADIDQRFSTFQMTALESAIIVGEARLVCMLLRRGGSLQEKMMRRRSDGEALPTTGMTLLELAHYFAEIRQDAGQQQVLASIEDFLATGSCTEGL